MRSVSKSNLNGSGGPASILSITTTTRSTEIELLSPRRFDGNTDEDLSHVYLSLNSSFFEEGERSSCCSLCHCEFGGLSDMHLQRNVLPGGLVVSVSPQFVSNVKCSDRNGELFSLLETASKQLVAIRNRY